LGTGVEGTVLTTVVHDVLSKGRAETADIRQQMLRGGIEVDAYAVHTTLDGLIQRVLEFRLIHIVLVLSDADTFRIDLDELGEGIH
jgi:hypothetical protein